MFAELICHTLTNNKLYLWFTQKILSNQYANNPLPPSIPLYTVHFHSPSQQIFTFFLLITNESILYELRVKRNVQPERYYVNINDHSTQLHPFGRASLVSGCCNGVLCIIVYYLSIVFALKNRNTIKVKKGNKRSASIKIMLIIFQGQQLGLYERDSARSVTMTRKCTCLQ